MKTLRYGKYGKYGFPIRLTIASDTSAVRYGDPK